MKLPRLAVPFGNLFMGAAFAVAFIGTCSQYAGAQRLPATVHPVNYKLALTPDLQKATFAGEETIVVVLDEPTKQITLNAIEITFGKVSVTAAGKTQNASVALDESKEQATFSVADTLPAGKAELKITYSGILNNELRGFYLSKTAKRNYAVTQFEPTDARRAFPCFDEPAFKATYDVTLVVDKNDTAISNSPIETDRPGPGVEKHTLHFAPTPKMSTYLVAFLVGDFQCSKGEQDSVAIRVCSTPDKVALTSYGVDITKEILHYYNNYFGISYPLKKLDLIALPDFEAGAMENFGAITYRETALLVDKKTGSNAAKKEVALVIAHEMAHQWFGDLVTMQWWDNLWLNEGFASWMENKPLEALHPEWDIAQTVISDKNNTLNLDALPTTRTIRAKADTPDEINQMFDGISYGKASAILLMVENYIGEKAFQQGVHNYLAAHLYGNAAAEDFWGAQTANSHEPVDQIMSSFVVQPGEPLLTFGVPTDGGQSFNGKLQATKVTQNRFFLSPSIHSEHAQQWTVPVCYWKGEKQTCQLLSDATNTLTAPADGFRYANADGKGYYRSAYPPSVYAELVAGVEKNLTASERINFIGDEWAQVRSNQSTVGDFLALAEAVKGDFSALVVGSALRGVDEITNKVAHTQEERAAMTTWIRTTYSPALDKLGAPTAGDAPNTRELRARIFGALGSYGEDPTVIAESRKIAEQYLNNPASVDGTIAETSLAVAARHGDAKLFDQLQKLYETSTNPELQIGALHMLALFEDPALTLRALNYATSSKVRNQDAAVQFSIALQNQETRDLAWKFIKENWSKVQAQLTTEMGGILVRSTGNFCSVDAREDVKNFFATHKVPASDKALKHAIEQIDGCSEFRTLQEPNLLKWMTAQK